ncbi:serine/threonine-protein kinase [Streptomyces sp. NPDC088246]|uniref:serine/threonine-protein kinase n=1 Tax=Streptomyces sp. NPDC088246 TaxID=3365842 RepID=UPI003817F526
MSSSDVTRRDQGSDGPRPGTAATRRDGSPWIPEAPEPQGLLRLPTALADRFSVVGELPHQGREADVLRVRDESGQDLVAKVYRSGVRVASGVWDRLRTLNSPHVVCMVEAGHSDGRDFELLEYLTGGSLEKSTGTEPVDVPVAEAVRQVAEALTHLHGAGIVHGDLKPSNILLRSSDPLDLALADFGVSKSLDATSRFTQRVFGTVSYCSPEYLLGAQVSAPQDWWALGVIVRQLATGRLPFDGLSEHAVRHHLATRPIDVTDVADERLRLLCQGLLVRDPERRWGPSEVRSWLDGASPQVAESDRTAATFDAGGRRPLAFKGVQYTEKTSLAQALATHWETAARRFFASMGTRENPSEGWRRLREWLAQFDDADDDIETLVELVDNHLTGSDTPDVKLLRLLRWLDPTMPPVYHGKRLLPQDLLALAQQASSVDDATSRAAQRLVGEIHTRNVLPLLAGSREATQRTADIDRRWDELIAEWSALSSSQFLPAPARKAVSEPDAKPELLALAVDPDRAQSLREQIETSATPARGQIGWFDDLLVTGDDPVRLLAAARTLPTAVVEADRLDQVRRTQEALATAHQRTWQEFEAGRLAGRIFVILNAIGGVALLFALPVGLPVLLAVYIGNGEIVAWAAVTCAVPLGCEIALATKLGHVYHPRWSLRARLANAGRRLAGRSREVSSRLGPLPKAAIGCGGCCLVYQVAAISGLVILTTRLWTAVPIGVAISFAAWTYARYKDWSHVHEAYRLQVLGEQ